MFSPMSSSVSSADSSSSSSSRDSPHRACATDHDDKVHSHRRRNRSKQRHRTSSQARDTSTSSSRGSSHCSSSSRSRNSDEVSLASTCDHPPRVNLPLDREFLPLQTDKEKENVRDQVICMIFDLPESTRFYDGTDAQRRNCSRSWLEDSVRVTNRVSLMGESLSFYDPFLVDFSCAIASTLAMHGRMYPTSTHVCFYSNVFGRERKVRTFESVQCKYIYFRVLSWEKTQSR